MPRVGQYKIVIAQSLDGGTAAIHRLKQAGGCATGKAPISLFNDLLWAAHYGHVPCTLCFDEIDYAKYYLAKGASERGDYATRLPTPRR